MKKLLGLLLNCVALCLCSAIGIGAGMYWMQNTQQNNSPVPVIQQVQATGVQPALQVPDLLPLSDTNSRDHVTPIPTTSTSIHSRLQTVASTDDQTAPKTDKTVVTLMVNGEPVGKGQNPDTNPITDNRKYFLSKEELNSISFKFESKKEVKKSFTILNGKIVGQVGSIADDDKTGEWPIGDQVFTNNGLKLKVQLDFLGATSPSVENFTFNIENDLYFKSVELPSKTGSPPLPIKNGGERLLAGPVENLDITIAENQTFDNYFVKLFRDDKEEGKKTKAALQSKPSFEIKQTGEYTLKLFKTDSTQPYEEYKFTIRNVDQDRPEYPVIDSVIDVANTSDSKENIVYKSPNAVVNGVPCYLLRKSNVTFNVSKAENRPAELEYQKIDSVTSGTTEFQINAESFVKESTDGDSEKGAFTLTSLAPGIYRFKVKDSWVSEQGQGESKTITLIVPYPDSNNPLQPSLVSYQNQKYADPNTNITALLNINVFGGYLELSGKKANPDRSLKFMLFKDDGTNLVPEAYDNLNVVYQTGKNDEWHATLEIKGPDEARTLYILRQDDQQHAFSKPIQLDLNAIKLPGPGNPPQLKSFSLGENNKLLNADKSVFYINTHSPVIKTTQASGIYENMQYVLFTQASNSPIGYGNYTDNLTAKLLKPLSDGQHRIYIKNAQGNQISDNPSTPFTLNIQVNGLEVVKVEPPNFGTAAGVEKLKITFTADNPLEIDEKGSEEKDPISWFQLNPSKGTGNFLFGETKKPSEVEYLAHENAVVLTFANLPADLYQLVIIGNKVKDRFGNSLEGKKGEPGTNYVQALSKPATAPKASGGSIPAEMAKVNFVKYHEYEKRELPEDGFNPSDRVVTKVARLYYYRDAHRVAQILNSEVKSMNHKGYHNAQLEADQAREMFQTAVLKRKMQEEKAIRAAQKLREKENEYRNQQHILSGLVQERANSEDETQNRKLEAGINKAQGEITKLRADITTLSSQMHEQDDDLKELNLKEADLSADLFRRELRAEKSDLYTIGNGKPDSYDAVEQVTIKVIGEGLIHLRGPIKGVNIIRTMINQIDAPVGQVRIAMHTIQVNGEDGKRMEIVADRIQKSIDQSRFLTVQSAQMLRKAIVSVASEVAISTCQDEFGMTQEQRDEKYLYAFFGRDFIEALREMDSEFLQSGNKLLSIHSMDTTSLSSALFVLALAKNEIRQQILAQFYASIESELTNAECQFLYQGGPTKANKHPHKMNLLAPYANFQSFKGFFDHEVIGTDTMTPVQREFVRLAQIFKAKLITERELNLHVMERAMIEQRMGDYEAELTAAKNKEAEAEKALSEVQTSIQKSQIEVVKTISGLQARVSQISRQFEDINTDLAGFQKVFNEIVNEILTTALEGKTKIDITLLSENRRAALLRQLFPIEETKKDNSIKPLQDRIFKVLKEFFPVEYKRYKDEWERRKPMLSRNEKGQFQVEQFQKQISENLQKEYAKNRSNRSNSKGKFKYGNKTFTFYIDTEGNFSLSSESQYKELDKITREYINQSIEVVKKLYWFKQNKNMKHKLELAEKVQLWIDGYDKDSLRDIHRVAFSYFLIQQVTQHTANEARKVFEELQEVTLLLGKAGTSSKEIQTALVKWKDVSTKVFSFLKQGNNLFQDATTLFQNANNAFTKLIEAGLKLKFAENNADNSRQQLDHKKFLDMQIDQTEDKYIELVEGTRAHTANIDNYLKLIATALEDDFNTQFYYPAFKEARDASRFWNVTFGSMETSSILTNNRSLGKVAPKATIEFDLPKRQLAIIEGMNIAQAAVKEYGALVNDPTFLAITSMNGGENVQGGFTIPPDSLDKQVLGQPGSQGQKFGSAFENLIPDPAVFKFETGTGFSVRPVIQPDGQAVVFDLNYLYRTDVREPVRADEKHLGRIKEHFIDTDVQLGNYELREISRFVIALKASRTGNGVPLLSDVPGVGVLFRPTPSAESSLQQSQILSQAVIYPTLFDLMGLRWAPAVADVGPLQLTERQFISKGRDRFLKNRVYDYAGSQVDKFLQIPDTERRSDLYRTQQTIPDVHPNGYMGPGLNLKRSTLQENFDTERMNPEEKFVPERNNGGAIDQHRAIPVAPPAEQGQLPPLPFGNRSSANPTKDSNIKPVGWNSTKTKAKKRTAVINEPRTIFSPRKVTRQTNSDRVHLSRTSPRVTPERSNRDNRPQPKAKPKSFYKRSASRLKSIFYKK